MKKKILILFAFLLSSGLSFGQSKEYSVLLFLLDDCVICQSYTPKINYLDSLYNEKVNFVGYFPNFVSKKKKIEEFKSKYKLKFDLKTDYYKSMATKYGIKVTPEVVIINNISGEVLYKGRIDDEFVQIGKRRRVVLNNELEDALEAITNDNEIVVKETIAIGCFINYNDLEIK